MLSELTKKGILTIKGLLDECKAGIEATNKDLEVIDEKYRKIIAEEKKTLKSNLSEYKAQLKQYEKMFATFDTTAVKEVLGDFESSSTEEEEQTVFDTVYPENNETEKVAESVTDADTVPADSVSATADVPADVTIEPQAEEDAPVKDLDAEEDAEWDEKIESGELARVEWPTEEQPVAEKKDVPVLTMGENDWPEFPADWQ